MDEQGNNLPEAEQRYRAIFEHSPDGILIIDPASGELVEFNEAAHNQLGYTKEEFSRLSIKDIDPDETPEEIKASLEAALARGRADHEVRHRTKTGDIRNVRVIAQALDINGQKFFQAIWRDITEQKRAEEELKKHREKLEHLVQERTAALQAALDNIKTLRGLLPMCAWCKKIRSDKGYWEQVELYIEEHSEASFTHGICPECLKKAVSGWDEE
jgi:PAS domain S-box-containing protein